MKIEFKPIDITKPLVPLHPDIMDGSYRDVELQRRRMMNLLVENIKIGCEVQYLIPRDDFKLVIPIEFTFT